MNFLGIETSPTGYALLSSGLIIIEAILLYVVYGAVMRRLSARFLPPKHPVDGGE